MSQDPIVREILDYLDGHNVMTLATAGDDGQPHAAAVFYASEHCTLFFVTDPATRHGSHLAANGAVAATIQDQPFAWTDILGLQLHGMAGMLDGAEAVDGAAVFIRKFPYVERMLDPAAASEKTGGIRLWRLVPRTIRLVDNRKGFGHRDEIELDAAGQVVEVRPDA